MGDSESMRILIVEDDKATALYLHTLLVPHGTCDIAKDGRQAVEAFKRAHAEQMPYDLILMDIMMPAMTGQVAVEHIRNDESDMGVSPSKEVPIIMVTALGDAFNVSQAFFKSYATGYVVKPVEPEDLFEAIRKAGVEIGPA